MLKAGDAAGCADEPSWLDGDACGCVLLLPNTLRLPNTLVPLLTPPLVPNGMVAVPVGVPKAVACPKAALLLAGVPNREGTGVAGDAVGVPKGLAAAGAEASAAPLLEGTALLALLLPNTLPLLAPPVPLEPTALAAAKLSAPKAPAPDTGAARGEPVDVPDAAPLLLAAAVPALIVPPAAGLDAAAPKSNTGRDAAENAYALPLAVALLLLLPLAADAALPRPSAPKLLNAPPPCDVPSIALRASTALLVVPAAELLAAAALLTAAPNRGTVPTPWPKAAKGAPLPLALLLPGAAPPPSPAGPVLLGVAVVLSGSGLGRVGAGAAAAPPAAADAA